MAKITRSDRRTDSRNGSRASGSNQSKKDKRDEHLAMARAHQQMAAEHIKKASGK